VSIAAEAAGRPDLLPLWAGQSAGLFPCSDAVTFLSLLVEDVAEVRRSHRSVERTSPSEPAFRSWPFIGGSMPTATIAAATMKAAQVPAPGMPFGIVEREIPSPGFREVRIKVQACGVCHSDAFTKEGSWPGIQYPRIPGHEVAGILDEVGGGIAEWKKGQRVGVGWHGGHDGTCRECRRGDFRNCPESPGAGHQLRRRLSGIHGGARRGAGCDTGRAQ